MGIKILQKRNTAVGDVICRARSFYLFLTQKKIPLRPKNHKQPMKRMTERPAVAQRRAAKNLAVRSVESDFYNISKGEVYIRTEETYRKSKCVESA